MTIEDQTLLKDIPVEKEYPIAHLLRVSSMVLKESKNKKHYLQFNLADSSTELKWCKKWDCTKADYDKFKKCKVLFVTGKTDVYNDNLQVVAESLAIPEDEVVTEFLEISTPTTPYDIKFLKKELWNFIKKVENEHIRELCLFALKDEEVKEHLSKSIAAQSVHHPYKGGLLTHIVRLLYITESVCDTFNTNMYPEGKYKVNKDLLIAGVIFHDLYKIREYEGMDYSLDGNLLPHLPTAAIQINRFMDQMEGEFPEEIRRQLTHIVLSHHNNLEWGSPVQPCTVEAVVLHYSDQLSAKVDPMLEALDALPEDENWTDRIKGIGKRAYRGGSLID